jgi:hypothetical protein
MAKADDTLFARIAGAGLLITVLTLILLFAIPSTPGVHAPPHALVLWKVEALAYMAIMIFGMALIRSHALTGAALATGGALNVIQLGIGLTMFRPLLDGGPGLQPMFKPVWMAAFYFFFAGKAALGLAGLSYGIGLWRDRTGVGRWLGGAALLTGLAGLVLGAAGMVTGQALIWQVGAVGTAAALFLGLALVVAPPRADT